MTLALYNTTLADLETLMRTWHIPPFRARQLYRHAYITLTDDVHAMTDLPHALRQHVADTITLTTLRPITVQIASDGNTRKVLFALPDGEMIETVLMLYDERATVCVSTQVGCGMACSFCATGSIGFRRQLTSGEIIEQVMWATREFRVLHPPTQRKERPTINVVFMGMGEPFANYDAWWAAVERLHDPHGFHLSGRKMTVSTVGIVPGIQRLAHESIPINLAISLHAADDTLRTTLVPANRRYPIDDILAAARDYIAQTHRRVSLEYVLIQKYNDQPEHAHMLAKRLRNTTPPHAALLFHVNLIPWNRVPNTRLSRSARGRVVAFQEVLQTYGIACTVRVERGIDIAAACGQLAGATHTTPHHTPEQPTITNQPYEATE